jgi:neural Wiskott-Aldrich syndrome protein
MDQSKKTMRHFYCRDVLWETFEQMANDFDCSIDYLVNEAMRYYARSKNYQSPGGPQMTGGQPVPEPRPNNSTNGPAFGAPSSKPPPSRQQPTQQPPPPQPGIGASPSSANAVRRPAPPTPGYSGRVAMPSAGPGGAHAAPQPQPQPQMAPAPPPPSASAPPMAPLNAGGGGPTLFLIYNSQRYPVTKDQFIIGRGSKTSDLAIKDGNISRKHAAVIRRNGTFYIKDLGSTNGIDYKGMRIDNKRIDEGDVFHLCDYELRFTYRTD